MRPAAEAGPAHQGLPSCRLPRASRQRAWPTGADAASATSCLPLSFLDALDAFPERHAPPCLSPSLSRALTPFPGSLPLSPESRRRRRSQPPRPQPLPRSLSAYPSSARTPSPSTSTHRSPDAPRRCRGASSPTTAAGCRRPIHPLRRLPEHADLLFELTVSSYASPLSSPPRLRPVASIPPEPELACRRPCRRRSHR